MAEKVKAKNRTELVKGRQTKGKSREIQGQEPEVSVEAKCG